MAYGDLKKRIDEKSQEFDNQRLMCTAHGCPQRWSVSNGSGELCSYHAWEPTRDWPRITQELRDIGPWLLTKKREPVAYDKNIEPKAWALRLKKLDEQGVQMTHGVRDMYKRALRIS